MSASVPRFILRYRQGENAWQEYALAYGSFSVGRDPACQVVVTDLKASRRHLSLSVQTDGVWIQDLGSRNGTRLEGSLIPSNQAVRIQPGQVFGFGACEFLVTEQADAAQPVQPAPQIASQYVPPSAIPTRVVKPPAVSSSPPAVSPSPPAQHISRSPSYALVALVLVMACIVVAGVGFLFLVGSRSLTHLLDRRDAPGNTGSNTPLPAAPVVLPALPPVAVGDQKWLVMIYSDADDESIERDLFFDVNESERVGSAERVHIVAQMDRSPLGFDGDGNWSGTKRFYVTQDDDLQRIQSQELDDLGEVNMGAAATLTDFIVWAVSAYRADKYVLVISNHGSGWPGISYDPDPQPADGSQADGITMNELDEALALARQQTGVPRFDVIALDACLMGQLEVLSALTSHTHYVVASEEVVPWVSMAYAGFLQPLRQNPGMSAADLAKVMVESYIDQDEMIKDDETRRDAARVLYNSPQMSAPDFVRRMKVDTTMSAVDMDALPDLINTVNDLASALARVDQGQVARSRAFSQAFMSAFGDDVPPSYIDLVHFCQMLQSESGDAGVKNTAGKVIEAVRKSVIAEKHGPERPSANGIAIYFPNSQLYSREYGGYEAYTNNASRFASQSQWDDFLAFHYTKTPLNTGAPQPGAQISAPGASGISISPVTASPESLTQDEKVTLTATVTGANIGYIYLLVGYYNEESDLMLLANADFVLADKTKQIGGVSYPDWGDTQRVDLSVTWKPVLFAIYDGVQSVYTPLQPERYGASSQELTYIVKGIYTFAQSGKQRPAKLIFDGEGNLRQVLGMPEQGGAGAPREITPQDGDQFTILKEWAKWGKIKEGVLEFVDTAGGTLTFGKQPFTWKSFPADPLPYYIGFMVEDLDGNRYGQFTVIRVEAPNG